MPLDDTNADQRMQDIARHFPTFLRRWRGATAQLADLSLSHPTLIILLRRLGQSGNLVIGCIGPTRIHAPHRWDDCDIEISVNADGGFWVLDHKADVKITTEHVEIAEDVKKYNWS
jgi:hypothetical protein